MRSMTEGVLLLPLVWLREPVLLVSWLLVVGVLFGAGKAVGLPMLFWNERPWRRFAAGVGSTLLTAEISFVLYLIQYGRTDPGRQRFLGHFLAMGALWLAVVLVRAAQLGLAERRPSAGGKTNAAPAGKGGVTPGMHTLLQHDGSGAGVLGAMVSARVAPAPFLAGVMMGAAITGGLLALDRCIGPAVDTWAAALFERLLGRPPREDLHLHVAAAVVFALLLSLFLALRRKATPALGLCALLSLFTGAYGFVTFWTSSRGAILVIMFLLLWRAGRPVYKIRIPALEPLYPPADPPPAGWKAVPYPPVTSAPPPLGSPLLLLDELAWTGGKPGSWGPAPLPNPDRRPLVLVCTSGGGIRAAVWTAGILGRLDAVHGLRLCTRMVTGASGGMVGAACWVAWRHGLAVHGGDPFAPADSGDWDKLLSAVAMDSLTPLARRLFFRDIPFAFWPRPNRHDRARALEDAWIENVRERLAAKLDVALAELRPGEEAGHWPSLVFSPMLIEDGRRLIVSNLALGDVLRYSGEWLTDDPAKPASWATSSIAAYHFASLFPNAWPNFPLSTAARLSAAFPYVSPAAVLPTEPRRRIVDAGYYDNYGLDLACNWLREAVECHSDWLRAHVSRVLVIQIRDNVSDLSVNPNSATERARGDAGTDRKRSAIARGLEGLSSPPTGLLTARDSVSLFRNDAQLETVMQLYHRVLQVPDFVTTAVFEFKGEASLSWYLTEAEISNLRQQAMAPTITGKIAAIHDWLTANGGAPRAVPS
jgi:hypothetical protein